SCPPWSRCTPPRRTPCSSPSRTPACPCSRTGRPSTAEAPRRWPTTRSVWSPRASASSAAAAGAPPRTSTRWPRRWAPRRGAVAAREGAPRGASSRGPGDGAPRRGVVAASDERARIDPGSGGRRMMKLPTRVTSCEVGPRDGFQIEPEWIPTETKVEVIDRLSETGLPRIEVTSFVHPKVVPQMRDAEEVMARIRRRPGTRYVALVPNGRGAGRAGDAGAERIHTVVSASESHNLANVNMTVAESLVKLRAVLEVAARAKVAVNCAISTSFGCPFEGDVPVERLEWVVR